MTQAEFNELPAVLTSWRVCQILGLNRKELAAEVAAGNLRTWQPAYVRKGCQSARPKYTKASVADRAGLKL